MSDPAVSSPEPAAHVAQALRALVGEIAQLAQSDAEAAEFHAEFLARVVPALAAQAGGVWLRGQGQWELHAQVNLDRTLALAVPRDRQQHQRLLDYAASRDQPLAAPPGWEVDGAEHGGNPTPLLLLLCPLTSEGEVLGLVEIVQRSSPSAPAQAGYLRFLSQLCSLAADYHQRRRGRLLREHHQSWQRFNDFVSRVHGHLDVPATAYAIANEGCRYIGCDRLSVAVRHGRNCRLAAVSGEEMLNPRATVVRLMQRLATVVARSGEPLWPAGDTASLAPEIEQALQAYLDQSHSRHLAIIPLKTPASASPADAGGQTLVGALVLEQFTSGAFSEGHRQRAALAAGHAASSLHNALEHNSLFLLPLWRTLGKAAWVVRARTLPKTLLISGLIAAAALALVYVPADFDVEVRGRLEPLMRREIYVPLEGQIEEVYVAHGQAVEKGDSLVRLRNTQHEYQVASLLGEMQTVEKQLAARKATALTLDRQAADSRARAAQLAAEIEELTVRQKNLHEQHELLRQQSEDLLLKSPIRGQVITWNVTDLLAARPVQRGQALLRVADTSGPWVLELNVPDRRIGHIRAAQQNLKRELDLAYLIATDPATEYPARIREVAMSAEVDEEHGSTVRLVADVDPRQSPPALRPGVSVIAKVHCGRRAVGYVWFHQLIEFIQSRVLFKL